jgi:hypothetical protein
VGLTTALSVTLALCSAVVTEGVNVVLDAVFPVVLAVVVAVVEDVVVLAVPHPVTVAIEVMPSNRSAARRSSLGHHSWWFSSS